MAYIDQLKCEERKAIEEFRQRIKSVLPKSMDDTIILHKFLIARDFDLVKAEQMIRKNILWRKSFQVDRILEDLTPREFFIKYTKSSHIGLDKEGDLVQYYPGGKLDGRDILKCSKMTEYTKYLIWHVEEMTSHAKQLMEKTGRRNMKLVIILNADKITIGSVTSRESTEICATVLSMLQDNYPENLKVLFVINAPAFYTIMHAILKSVLSKATMKKLKIFGKSGWKEKLLEVIDADVLPAFMGGNRTDPDGNPLCNTFIRHGGKIPEIHHLPDEERYFKEDKSQIKQITVPRSTKREIPVYVTEYGSLIRWKFLVKSKDIGFGLYYKASDQDLEEVLPVQRFDTFDGTEEGSYKTQSIGKYVVSFDNSYSWMNSKDIEYCITVIKPEY